MKLIEAKQAKEYANTYLPDPILRMAVNAVLDNCPGIDIDKMLTRCGKCKYREKVPYPEGKIWCPRIGRYMKLDGFCSEGVKMV